MANQSDNGEVTLVDENDNVIGVLDVLAAHRGAGKLHRAISVYLFRVHDGTLELLIQQRSAHKIVGAEQWANTVCGNVWPNESYEACAFRRLRDELNITNVTLTPIYKFRYQVRCNAEFSENEIDQVFFGWCDDVVQPNSAQAQDYRWVDWAEMVAQGRGGESELDLAPWFVIMLNDDALLAQLAQVTP